jgi:hypothetical protein
VRIFHRRNKIIPVRLARFGQQPSGQFTAFAEQGLDCRGDVFGLNFGKARQTGKIE